MLRMRIHQNVILQKLEQQSRELLARRDMEVKCQRLDLAYDAFLKIPRISSNIILL
jgi:hypothetical protein